MNKSKLLFLSVFLTLICTYDSGLLAQDNRGNTSRSSFMPTTKHLRTIHYGGIELELYRDSSNSMNFYITPAMLFVPDDKFEDPQDCPPYINKSPKNTKPKITNPTPKSKKQNPTPQPQKTTPPPPTTEPQNFDNKYDKHFEKQFSVLPTQQNKIISQTNQATGNKAKPDENLIATPNCNAYPIPFPIPYGLPAKARVDGNNVYFRLYFVPFEVLQVATEEAKNTLSEEERKNFNLSNISILPLRSITITPKLDKYSNVKAWVHPSKEQTNSAAILNDEMEIELVCNDPYQAYALYRDIISGRMAIDISIDVVGQNRRIESFEIRLSDLKKANWSNIINPNNQSETEIIKPDAVQYITRDQASKFMSEALSNLNISIERDASIPNSLTPDEETHLIQVFLDRVTSNFDLTWDELKNAKEVYLGENVLKSDEINSLSTETTTRVTQSSADVIDKLEQMNIDDLKQSASEEATRTFNSSMRKGSGSFSGEAEIPFVIGGSTDGSINFEENLVDEMAKQKSQENFKHFSKDTLNKIYSSISRYLDEYSSIKGSFQGQKFIAKGLKLQRIITNSLKMDEVLTRKNSVVSDATLSFKYIRYSYQTSNRENKTQKILQCYKGDCSNNQTQSNEM